VDTDRPEPRVRPIPSSLILLAGAVFALLVLVVSFFVAAGIMATAGARVVALPGWVDANTLAYANWPNPSRVDDLGLPPLWGEGVDKARTHLLAVVAKELHAELEAVQDAWPHIRGVEAAWPAKTSDRLASTGLPLVVCVHLDSPGYLARWMAGRLDLPDPIIVRGRDVYRFSARLFLASAGRTLLAAPSLAQMEALLGRMASEPPDALAAQARFARAADRHSRAGLAWAYMQPPGLLGLASLARVTVEWRSPAGLLLGLAGARAAVVTGDVSAHGAAVSGAFYPAKLPNQGANWLGLRNTSAKALLRFVPARTPWFLVASAGQASALWKTLVQWLADVGRKEGLRSEVQVALQRWETDYATEIKTDLAPYVGPEIALFAVTTEQATHTVLAAELLSPKDVRVTLSRMEASPKLRHLRYENQPHRGEPLRVAELDEGISYALVGDCLLASFSVDALRAAISASKDGQDVTTGAPFAAASAAMPRECALLAMVRADRFPWLPASEPGPGPVLPPFVALAGVAQPDRLDVSASVAWQQGEAGPVETDALLGCRSHLRLTAAALTQYSADYGGHFPCGRGSSWANLSLLLGRYLREPETLVCPGARVRGSRLKPGQPLLPSQCGYEYVALTPLADGSMIVAYDKSPDQHDGEGRHVLLRDRTVQWMTEDQFRRKWAWQAKLRETYAVKD